MSERFNGVIRIGGKMSKEQLFEVFKQLKPWGFSDGPCIVDGRIEASDFDARYGCFPELEEFLVRENISFQRSSDAYGGDPAFMAGYDTEKGSYGRETQDDGSPLVCYHDLIGLVGALAGKSTEDLPIIAASEEGW